MGSAPMDSERIAHEIERLRRRWEFLAEGGAGRVPSVWELVQDSLRWHVVLGEVLEPDLDVEVREEVLVVRALERRTVRVCVLPVPAPWRPTSAHILFRDGVLEIVIEAVDG